MRRDLIGSKSDMMTSAEKPAKPELISTPQKWPLMSEKSRNEKRFKGSKIAIDVMPRDTCKIQIDFDFSSWHIATHKHELSAVQNLHFIDFEFC